MTQRAAKTLFALMRQAIEENTNNASTARFRCLVCSATFDVPQGKKYHCTISQHCPKCGANRFEINHNINNK